MGRDSRLALKAAVSAAVERALGETGVNPLVSPADFLPWRIGSQVEFKLKVRKRPTIATAEMDYAGQRDD